MAEGATVSLVPPVPSERVGLSGAAAHSLDPSCEDLTNMLIWQVPLDLWAFPTVGRHLTRSD
eukprot:14786240-Alexandrium_andersonii.AAC.1